MATYDDVLRRLVGARRFGVVFGLERMQSLLRSLGSPDQRLGRVIHVGGTNGKGSTVAILAQLARTAGLRVAAYTSPHLCTLRERIMIDGEMISGAAFVANAERVWAAGGDVLTFFEQVTAIAACAIADAKVDLTILEVGLGGRLDATNAIAADVAVVTGVAMDHEAILGDTLAKIAAEKAGIFKRGQRIVIGASGLPDAVPVLREAARAVGVYPVVVDDDMIARVPPLSLAGTHQRANAACALAAAREMSDVVVPPPSRGTEEAALANADRNPTWVALTSPDVQARALASVVHPGRFEIIPDAWIYPAPAIDIPLGDVILDGAHNPQGCAALADVLRERGVRPTLILSVSADKDVRAMLRALLPAVGDVIVTQYAQERAMPCTQLEAIVREVSDELGPITWRELPRRPSVTEPREIRLGGGSLDWTLYFATQTTHPDQILVAGSLFLVGELRTRLLRAPTDPFIATDPAPLREDDFDKSG